MTLIHCEATETERPRVKRWMRALGCAHGLDERAAVLRLVAQATRLRLFHLLDQMGEVCVCDLAEILTVAPSTVCQQLAKFKAHGLVTAHRRGLALLYRLSDSPHVKLLRRVALGGLEAPTDR